MEKYIYRKSTGCAICAFYGLATLGSAVQLICNKFGCYNPTYTPIFWIVYDALCCVAMGGIALNKTIRPSLLGRIGAGLLAAIYAIFTVNLFLIYAEIDVFTILGPSSGIVVAFVEFVAAALLFYSLRIWLPVKLSASIYWIPTVCSSFYFAEIKDAVELAQENSDLTIVGNVLNAIEICGYISIILAILTVILTVVWMTEKPSSTHVRSNTIDMI